MCIRDSRHRPQLSDAVRAAQRLVFGGRVPPRVDDQQLVGRGEIEAEAARLQADQEQAVLALLEGVDAPRSLGRRRAAVQVLVPMPAASSRSVACRARSASSH